MAVFSSCRLFILKVVVGALETDPAEGQRQKKMFSVGRSAFYGGGDSKHEKPQYGPKN